MNNPRRQNVARNGQCRSGCVVHLHSLHGIPDNECQGEEIVQVGATEKGPYKLTFCARHKVVLDLAEANKR